MFQSVIMLWSVRTTQIKALTTNSVLAFGFSCSSILFPILYQYIYDLPAPCHSHTLPGLAATTHTSQTQTTSYHIEAEAQWLTFCRWHVQICFLVWLVVLFWFKFHWSLFPRVQNKPALVQIKAWCWTGDKSSQPIMALCADSYMCHSALMG